jgi:hypothetical protein
LFDVLEFLIAHRAGVVRGLRLGEQRISEVQGQDHQRNF